MINSTSVVPVNPRGESPLTREQLWKGLVLKARDARLFLPQGAATSFVRQPYFAMSQGLEIRGSRPATAQAPLCCPHARYAYCVAEA
jgi:hypothetical protein